MRTPLLMIAGSLLLAVGCTVGEGPGGPSGDDDGGAVCGDGIQEGSEACDDGNSASGDGCSSTCTSELNPRLTSSVDKTAITTELGKTEKLTLTLTSVDGFEGAVTVAPTVVVGATPVTGLTVQGPASINVGPNATVTTEYTLAIPSNLQGADLAATINLDLGASVAVQDVSAALNVAAIYTVIIAAGTGTADANHRTGAVTIKRGTNIRFVNNDTIQHITHGGPKYPHQTIAANTGLPGQTYEVETQALAPGAGGKLGCHNHQGDNTYVEFILE